MIQIVVVAAYEAVTRTSRRLSKRRALQSGYSKEDYKALDRDVMGRAFDPSCTGSGKRRRLSRNEERAWMAFLAKERDESKREAEWRREGERLPSYGENVRVRVAEPTEADADEDAVDESDDDLQSLRELRRDHQQQSGGELALGRRHTVGSTSQVFPHLRVTEREICWAGSPAYEQAVGEEVHSVTAGRRRDDVAGGTNGASVTDDATTSPAPRRSAPLYLPPPPGKTMADLRRTTSSGCA